MAHLVSLFSFLHEAHIYEDLVMFPFIYEQSSACQWKVDIPVIGYFVQFFHDRLDTEGAESNSNQGFRCSLLYWSL